MDIALNGNLNAGEEVERSIIRMTFGCQLLECLLERINPGT
jgi:hypothetical protein